MKSTKNNTHLIHSMDNFTFITYQQHQVAFIKSSTGSFQK